jgi:hypothetical protein
MLSSALSIPTLFTGLWACVGVSLATRVKMAFSNADLLAVSELPRAPLLSFYTFSSLALFFVSATQEAHF